jgi:cob(I)alamin adenosyltransferase
VKIYTKTGDDGSTGLFGGGRVSKSDRRVEAYGDVDELGSVLGVARAQLGDGPVDELLATIQSRLFDLGAELASTPGRELALGAVSRIDEESVQDLERAIDAAEEPLPALTSFVLAGGSQGASFLHLARTVCRRAERHLVRLAQEEPVRPVAIHYLNRLSDLLFVLARAENHARSVPDEPWLGRKG